MRRDKINTLLMKQDFMVHEQQEPREKKEENIDVFPAVILTIFLRTEIINYK